MAANNVMAVIVVRRRPQMARLVPARAVRLHLLELRRRGVGYVAVSAACDLSTRTLCSIVTGATTFVHPTTRDRVLSVTADATADGACVPAAPTWALIAELLEEGFTKQQIARRLHPSAVSLQLGRERVRAATALRVKRLHRELTT